MNDYRPANPLVVQSDSTVLVEVASPRYPAVRDQLAAHPLTDAGLAQFMKDWAKTGQKIV